LPFSAFALVDTAISSPSPAAFPRSAALLSLCERRSAPHLVIHAQAVIHPLQISRLWRIWIPIFKGMTHKTIDRDTEAAIDAIPPHASFAPTPLTRGARGVLSLRFPIRRATPPLNPPLSGGKERFSSFPRRRESISKTQLSAKNNRIAFSPRALRLLSDRLLSV
jgi:hypothetical protein